MGAWLSNTPVYLGGFLSQAPTISMLLGKTLPDLKKVQTFVNSTFTYSTSLGHFRTPRFFFRWTVVCWWSPGLRENGHWSPLTSESLYGIVWEWYRYDVYCKSYLLKALNFISDKYSESQGSWSKYPEVLPSTDPRNMIVGLLWKPNNAFTMHGTSMYHPCMG